MSPMLKRKTSTKARLLLGGLILATSAAASLSSIAPAGAVDATPVAWKTSDTTGSKIWPDIAVGTEVTLEFIGCRGDNQRLELSRWFQGEWKFQGFRRGAAAASITYTPPLGSSDAIANCFDYSALDAAKAAADATLTPFTPPECPFGQPPTSPLCPTLINNRIVTFSTFRPEAPLSTEYRSIAPGRLLDTRAGGSTVDGRFAGIGVRAAGTTLELDVTGRQGVPLDAKAVSLNVTVTGATAGGFLTVFPCGGAVPDASNVNFGVGDTIPNAVISSVGPGGKVCIFTAGRNEIIADVNGYFPADTTFVGSAPSRLLDSRPTGATIDNQSSRIGLRPAGSVTELVVAGRNGVPATAKSVALNVTVTEATDAGFVTVFPCGSAKPDASNLNFSGGQTIANLVVATVGAGGKVCLFTSAPTQMIADANGYLPSTTRWVPRNPDRILDTRLTGATADGRYQREGVVYKGGVKKLPIAGRLGIPSTATTVILNITATNTQTNGFLTVYPCSFFVPNASNVNFNNNSTIPNAVVAQLSDLGEICIYSDGIADVIVDVSAYLVN
jgi:hypothetical protein